MKSTEPGVLKKSEVYFSTPSQTAKKLYYYPTSAGHFFCVDGYHLIRGNYQSLLITHIIEGTFTFVDEGKHITAKAGDTVILNCYKPHEYYTDDHFESIWIHFCGANSLELFAKISTTYRNCFSEYGTTSAEIIRPTNSVCHLIFINYLPNFLIHKA